MRPWSRCTAKSSSAPTRALPAQRSRSTVPRSSSAIPGGVVVPLRGTWRRTRPLRERPEEGGGPVELHPLSDSVEQNGIERMTLWFHNSKHHHHTSGAPSIHYQRATLARRSHEVEEHPSPRECCTARRRLHLLPSIGQHFNFLFIGHSGVDLASNDTQSHHSSLGLVRLLWQNILALLPPS